MNPKEEKTEEINSSSPSFRVGSPTTISAASVLDQIQYSSSSDDDDAFEFAALGDAASTADEMFDGGWIRPVYPVFDRSLLNDVDAVNGERKRGSLRKLFLLERGGSDEDSSSSSSEADELEGVPEGTYCVWTPKAKESAEKCRKSGSTGSSTSLRVKFRDLVIGRSSDGKEKFLFVSNNGKDGKGKRAGSGGSNRKKTTFLPYKQDLVGFFSSVNSISRNHHPF